MRSILAQTFENWELLLVDNGSSDNSYEIISNYAIADNRIHALQEFKRGVSAARNTALDNAKGKYVCFIDSDDEVEKDYLEQLLNEPDADLTVCGYFVDVETQDGNTIKSKAVVPDKTYWKKDKSKAPLKSAFENGFMHLCCNKLFRREIIDFNNIRFQFYPVNEDYIFTLTFLKYADSISIIDKPIYHWIRIEGNVSGVNALPDNLLDIYNESHLATRGFFDNNRDADTIAYYSYEMIIYKYYEALKKGRLSKHAVFNKLNGLTRNGLVNDAYRSYKPKSLGESLLNKLMKLGLYKTHYFITQKILK